MICGEEGKNDILVLRIMWLFLEWWSKELVYDLVIFFVGMNLEEIKVCLYRVVNILFIVLLFIIENKYK